MRMRMDITRARAAILMSRTTGADESHTYNRRRRHVSHTHTTGPDDTLRTRTQQVLMTRIALRVRSALMCTLYRKAIRLAGLGESSTGQIQNLMVTDAQFFLQLAPMVNMVFTAPLQVG